MRARQWSSTSPRARKASRPRTSSAYKTSAPRAKAGHAAVTCSRLPSSAKPQTLPQGRVFSLPLQALQSPARVLGNNRIFVATQFFQHRQEALVSAVAHRDCNVAAKSVQSCALYRRAAKDFAELIDAKPRQPFELGVDQLRPRLEFRHPADRSFTVPRANILADVASEDLSSDASAQFFRDRAALLDGEIRNALGGVELIRRGKRIRRTNIETARAGAAAVRRRQIGCQFQRSEHHAEEKPRAQLLVQDAGVLANPANSRALGEDALDHRTSVNVTPGPRRRNILLRTNFKQPRFQRAQFFEYHIVVVVLRPRVARDPALRRRARVRGVRLSAVVIQRADHDRTRPRRSVGQRSTFQLASLVAILKVAHLAGVTFSEPAGKESMLFCLGHTSDACEIEADLGSETLDFAADDGQRQSAGHAGPIIGGWDALFAVRPSLFANLPSRSVVSIQPTLRY